MKKTIFAGFGGQGVLLMGYVFAVAAMKDGKNVTYLPSYGAEMRGGTANCTVAVSDDEIFSPVASTPDYAVIMNKPSLAKYENMMKSGGMLFINSSIIPQGLFRSDLAAVRIPANDIAREVGSDRVVNMIMLGASTEKTRLTSLESIISSLQENVKAKSASVMKLNKKALYRGAEYVSRGNE